jgi:RNA polymerase sigma-70 factor (ECF subfamily)
MSASANDGLVRRASQGDESAIAALYDLYADAIYRYVLYRVPGSADAEDLTAEVFLRMVEGLPRYKQTGAPFEAWLYRIAAARIADFYRQSKRRPQIALDDELGDTGPLPEEQLLARQELDHLRSAIQQFNEEEQSILILRFVERKSHQEVGQILGKSTGAIRAAQHRALIRLAGLLGSEEKVRHYLRGDDD